MDTLSIEHFTASVWTFIRTADPGVVLTIVVLLFLCLQSRRIPFDGRETRLAVWAFLFAVPVTWLLSLAPDIDWSTRLFWRGCLQNAAVAVVLWHLLLPRFRARWSSPPPGPPPKDVLWQEPVEKKKP